MARADEPAGPEVEIGVPSTPAPESAPEGSPSPARPKEVRDAHADRVVLMPTAYTHPAGTVYLSNYDIFLLQAGYAVSDTTQITLTSTVPIEGIVFADFSLKSVIAHEGPVRVAAFGSITGVAGLDPGLVAIGRAGAVAELCFDDACSSSASMGTNFLLAGSVIATTGVGLIWRIVPWMSLLAEVDTVLPLSREAGRTNGVSLAPAFRFPHKAWALDVGFARPLGVSEATTIPFVAFTWRFLP